MGFLISNQKIEGEATELKFLSFSEGYYVYATNVVEKIKFAGLYVFVLGNVQPRNEYFQEYKYFSDHELIFNLYRNYQSNFIDYIKGNFVILIIGNGRIELYTDHFGLGRVFIYQKSGHTALASSISLIRQIKPDIKLDIQSLVVKALLNSVPSEHTPYKDIIKSLPGTHILIKHGNISIEQYWKAGNLLVLSKIRSDSFSLENFVELIKQNFNNFLLYCKPDQHAITLTGGKDSRSGLAALKANGISPFGFTYGNPLSRDAVYARKLADVLSITYHVFSAPDTEDYFKKFAAEIISYGHPDISLHRAHRLYAFKKMAEFLNDTSAYYAGYMAGEFLMGVYYDSLVFTDFLTTFWDSSVLLPTGPILENSFIRPGIVDVNDIGERLNELRTFDSSLNLKKRQFYGIFEIGIPHHSQDIFLASQCFDFVYPFFIDIDFLVALFQSRYNFFFTDNKTGNLLNRYKLYEFNLNIQHILFPGMDNVQFGKRGSYNTREFLRGKYYWAALKTIRYLFQRQKYPPSYAYGKNYRDFLLSHLKDLNRDKSNELHAIYDVPEAMKKLEAIGGYTNEAAMHRFTNIVQLFLQLKYYKYQN